MKKIFSLVLVTALLLTGCSSGGKTAGNTERKVDPNTAKREQIEEYIDSNFPAGYYSLLADDDEMAIVITDKSAIIQFRVFMDYLIPYFAEEMIPVVQQAAQEAGTEFDKISFNYYRENKDGKVKGSWVSWQTADGTTGTYTNEAAEKKVVPKMTLDELLEYYADYKSIADDMIAEHKSK